MSRVVTAIVAIPLVVLITLYAPSWLFAFVVGLVSALAIEEFLELASKKGIGRPGRWFLVPAAVVAIAFMGNASWVLSAFVFAAMLLMSVTAFSQPMETALGRVGM